MVMVEGIAVSGKYIESLKDKRFAIVGKPFYKDLPTLNDPQKVKRVLCMSVKLMQDGSILDYYPNSSSVRTMTNMWGFELDAWVSHVFEWFIVKQPVMGALKDVLFVKDHKFDDVVPLESKA